MNRYPEISRREALASLPEARIVTVNQRLARELQEAYASLQRSRGASAWRKPPVGSWDHWLAELLGELDMDDLLLSEAQELHLWEQVIGDSLTPDQRLQLQVPLTARMAREAHRLLGQYLARCDGIPLGDDHRVFLAWRERWQMKMRTLQCLDRAELVHPLRDALLKGELNAPRHLIFAGFDDLRPDQRLLLDALVEQGATVQLWNGAGEGSSQPRLVAAPTPEEELRACARWAKHLLSGGDCRIGVVMPEPHVYRSRVEEIFLAELAPRELLSGEPIEGLYSFSLGSALAEEGLVACALQLLTLGGNIHFDQVSALLRSPWVGDLHRDGEGRARLESDLREAAELYWTPRGLQKFRPSVTGKRAGGGSPERLLATVAAHISESLALQRKRFPASYWARHLLELLASCGWPGARTLNSRDYQAREELREVFDELSSLERLGSPLSRSEAVSFVTRRCQERVFQVRQSEGAIQVLGLLEVSGISFDHLWLLGFHDGAFPSPARPNPFIPIPLQREMGMPHADASRELDFARQVSSRLFSASGTLVASYPLLADGAERQPSSFVRDFPTLEVSGEESSDPLRLLQGVRPPLEPLADSRGPAVSSIKAVSGGTGIIKDQALCPFRAFSRYRLRCEALRTLDVGLNPFQRGNLVHGMLEGFWKLTVDLDALCRLNEEEIRNRLRECAQASLGQLRRRSGGDWPRDVQTIEVDRLVELGMEWLELEKLRAPFEAIEFEQDRTCRLGKLEIRTKVDRVDRLAAGGLAVIDYKTGACEPERWLGERISEPQLPIYTQEYDGEEISAVLFAQVRRGECRFKGIAENEDQFPNVPGRTLRGLMEEGGQTFSSLLERWPRDLERLAADFVDGDARVLPLDPDRTCTYCDYPALCRIFDAADASAGREDD